MSHFIEVADGICTLGVPFFDGLYRTTATLVRMKDTFCLIDSGENSENVDTCIVPALELLGIQPSDVGCLLATHTHFDHIGGHTRFRELSGCRILLAKTSAEVKRNFHVDEWAEENQILGGRLRLICTPGHAPDAVSWWDEKTGTLITGDSFQAEGTCGVGLALYRDPGDYEKSVNKAQALKPERIVAGHAFAPFNPVIEGENVGAFFEKCLAVTKQYREFLKPYQKDEAVDIEKLTSEMILRFERHYEAYISRGDSTVRAFLREKSE